MPYRHQLPGVTYDGSLCHPSESTNAAFASQTVQSSRTLRSQSVANTEFAQSSPHCVRRPSEFAFAERSDRSEFANVAFARSSQTLRSQTVQSSRLQSSRTLSSRTLSSRTLSSQSVQSSRTLRS